MSKGVHVIADCQDCDWQSEDYKMGRTKAAQHARKTGHSVHIEVGTAYTIARARRALND